MWKWMCECTGHCCCSYYSTLYSFYKFKTYADIRWGSSGRGRQRTVGLSTMTFFRKLQYNTIQYNRPNKNLYRAQWSTVVESEVATSLPASNWLHNEWPRMTLNGYHVKLGLCASCFSQSIRLSKPTTNKKAELSQRWPRDAPYIYGCPENFRESLSTPTAAFPKIFNGLLFRPILWMCVQNLKFVHVALPVRDILGGT